MDLFDIVAARVGGGAGGGAPQIQSDWEQNDSSKKDYIKNKPFYLIDETETTTITRNFSFNPDDLNTMVYDRLYIHEGEVYTLKATINVNGTLMTEQIDAVAETIPGEMLGIDNDVVGIVVDNVVSVYDGVRFDSVSGDSGTPVLSEDHCIIGTENSALYTCKLEITGRLGKIYAKKLDNKFLNINNTIDGPGELPISTQAFTEMISSEIIPVLNSATVSTIVKTDSVEVQTDVASYSVSAQSSTDFTIEINFPVGFNTENKLLLEITNFRDSSGKFTLNLSTFNEQKNFYIIGSSEKEKRMQVFYYPKGDNQFPIHGSMLNFATTTSGRVEIKNIKFSLENGLIPAGTIINFTGVNIRG